MAMLRDLIQVQLGTEVSTDAWGTVVAPTVKLMGISDFTITPIRATEQIGEIRGSLAPAFQSVRTMEEASATISGALVYEDAPYWLGAMFGDCNSSDLASYTTNASAVITRVYKAPLATFDSDLNSPRVFTLVHGDDVAGGDVINVVGATMNNLTISGEDGGILQFSGDFIGRSANTDTLGSLSDRTVVVGLGSHVNVYVDPSTDAAGTTQIDNLGFSFELNVSANRELVRHLGALNPDDYRDAAWSGTLGMMLELNTDSQPFLDSILTTTPFERVVRIEATTGSGATERELEFDFNGVQLEAPQTFTDEDGVVTVELSLTGQYHSTLANWLIMRSKNAVASLP